MPTCGPSISLLIRARAKLTGVLDYWPRIADPAGDFKALECYGPQFVAEVYEHYQLPRDASFDARRLFYTGHDEVFEFARAIDRGDPARLPLARSRLHPTLPNVPPDEVEILAHRLTRG